MFAQRCAVSPIVTARRTELLTPSGLQGSRAPGAGPMAALVVLVITVLLAACTNSTDTSEASATPTDPAAALAAASAAMAGVASAHFTLNVNGQLPNILVSSAEGDLTREGDARGTATVSQFGQTVEVEFVLADQVLYVKGPTGGFSQIPGALAGEIYDPSGLLSPDRGVSKVLSSVTDPTLVSADDQSVVVAGNVPQAVAVGILPGLSSDVRGTFTLDARTSELTAATFETPGQDGQPATVDVRLTELDEPLDITAPA